VGGREGEANGGSTDAPTRVLGASEELRMPGGQADAALKHRLLSAAGGTIGRFVVLRELGEGGMGMVFAAYDAELDRKVAIKLLRMLPGGDSLGRSRLLREAQALARLSHPNVVTIYEVGEYERQVFLAMEFVAGPTLQEWLAAAPREPNEVVRVFLEAGRGLAAAHAADILHRDFKPANVLLGDDGRVRVADFGLAQAQDRRDLEHETSAASPVAFLSAVSGSFSSSPLTQPLTVAGTIVGTPSYMSPERFIAGSVVDARADQFSFCVALHEALYGARPFGGGNFDELQRAVLAGEVPPAPASTKVPAWLRRVVLRGLAHAPESRFASMPDLLAALARDPGRTRRRALVAGGAAALLVGGGYGLALTAAPPLQEPSCQDARSLLHDVWDLRRDDVRRSLLATGTAYAADTAVRVTAGLDRHADAWAQVHQDACVAHQRGEQSATLLDLRMTCLERRRYELAALVARLADANTDTVRAAVAAQDQLTPITTCSDVATLTAAIPPPEDPETATSVATQRERITAARAAGSTRRLAEAQAIAAEVELAAHTLGYRPLLAEALAARGHIDTLSGRYEDAAPTLTRALWLADACRDDVLLASVMAELVVVLGDHLARYDEALRWRAHADAVVLRLGPETRSNAILLRAFATVLDCQGRSQEAIPLLEQALAIQERLVGPQDLRLLPYLRGLGNAHFTRGDVRGAQALYRRELALAEQTYGPQHPDVARVAGNLGTTHASLGDLDAALPLFERALAIDEATLGPEHPELSASLSNIGSVLAQRGEWRRAQALFGRAIAIDERALGPEHPGVAETVYNLAMLHTEFGDDTAARPLLLRVLKIAEANLSPDHPLLVDTLVQLAQLSLRAGKPAEATPRLERALVLLAASTLEGHRAEMKATADFALAQTLAAAGKRPRARTLAAEAATLLRTLDAARFAERIAEIEAWAAALRR
jgi:tetratricopeptide (TPR) repeat protein/predicted Ser/Thr protein kinase